MPSHPKVAIPSKKELENFYLKPGETISSTARYFKTNNPRVRAWLDQYNISKKSHQQASTEANRKKTASRPDRDTLLKLYEKCSVKDLERTFAVSQNTIYQWLDEYSIKRMTNSERATNIKAEKRKELTPDIDHLKEIYDDLQHQGLTAEYFGISVSFLKKLLAEYDIETHSPMRSSVEADLFEYCKTLRPDLRWISNDRSVITPLELDIYSPDGKIAIEYCGHYWHSEYYGSKDKTYHKNKCDLAADKSIFLITVFEGDDIENIKRLIRNKLGVSKRIGARETKCERISSQDARMFADKYHLHGSVGAEYHYGLYHNRQLVMVSSFGKNRFSKDISYELIRMTVGDISVLGGFSKTLKHFFDDSGETSLLTFADRRFGDGSIYKRCGFDFVGHTEPGYYYFNKNNSSKLYSRNQFQKHKLKERLDHFDNNLTEYENMKMNGWDRIWDCGHAKFVLYK